MSSWADVLANSQGVVHKTNYTLYSVCGTGVAWNVGYPFDLGDALATAGIVDHQPIGYEATAFPMAPSIAQGEAELVRQILLRSPSEPWAMVGYSQGAIITSNVYDRIRGGDLKAYEATFLGGVTFGNPRRQADHTIPGGIDNGGMGIVTPNLVNTEDKWWDFADDKSMVGSPGDDMYCKCGKGITAAAVADQRAVWQIVLNGSFKSIIGLAEDVFKILPDPINGGVGAVEAALNALDFLVVKGITPHTSYQIAQPIAGDPRDCWRVALDYLTQLSPQQKEATIMTAPEVAPIVEGVAKALNLGSLEGELKGAISGLLEGLRFAQKFEGIIPLQYRATIDAAVKILTLVDGLL